MSELTDAIGTRIDGNWQRVRAEVVDACAAANRPAASVRIVGVTKYVGPAESRRLAEAGCGLLAESKPQEIWAKHGWFADHAQSVGQPEPPLAEWHLVGHLQRNKVRRTLPLIACLHSLDSLRLASAVSNEAERAGIEISSLVEVNVTEDSAKTGLPATDAEAFVEAVLRLPGIRLCGLMAMASHQANSAQARREFATVRQLKDRLSERFAGDVVLPELSMGMSGDFCEAIAEGATLVRIGSALWEGVPRQHARA